MDVIANHGLVQTVSRKGRSKRRHLAPERLVPVSQEVWTAPACGTRDQYLQRVRDWLTEDTTAPACVACWLTLPGWVAVRLTGPPGAVAVASALLEQAGQLESGRLLPADPPGAVLLYAAFLPPETPREAADG